jgi:hypothetical protein
VRAPRLLYHVDEVFKDGFTTALRENVLNNLAAAKQVCIPEVGQQDVLKLSSNVKLR